MTARREPRSPTNAANFFVSLQSPAGATDCSRGREPTVEPAHKQSSPDRGDTPRAGVKEKTPGQWPDALRRGKRDFGGVVLRDDDWDYLSLIANLSARMQALYGRDAYTTLSICRDSVLHIPAPRLARGVRTRLRCRTSGTPAPPLLSFPRDEQQCVCASPRRASAT